MPGRIQLTLAFAVGIAGSACGTITFDPIDEPDGGVEVPDVGTPDMPDVGFPDAGPKPDLGCIEHVLPTSLPSSWPFERSERAVELLFLERLSAEVPQCNGCHASDNTGAEVVFASLGTTAEYDQTINNMWASLADSEPATAETATPVGTLWYHHKNSDIAANDPHYTDEMVDFLNVLRTKAIACNTKAYLDDPMGPLCMEPSPRPDAGPGPADGGPGDGGAPPDSGVVDSGTGGVVDCYCRELPDAGLRLDLIAQCAAQ